MTAHAMLGILSRCFPRADQLVVTPALLAQFEEEIVPQQRFTGVTDVTYGPPVYEDVGPLRVTVSPLCYKRARLVLTERIA